MSSFLKSASKQVTDVRNFLRETAGGNGIKYVSEKAAEYRAKSIENYYNEISE